MNLGSNGTIIGLSSDAISTQLPTMGRDFAADQAGIVDERRAQEDFDEIV
jgi:hypothetical protein